MSTDRDREDEERALPGTDPAGRAYAQMIGELVLSLNRAMAAAGREGLRVEVEVHNEVVGQSFASSEGSRIAPYVAITVSKVLVHRP